MVNCTGFILSRQVLQNDEILVRRLLLIDLLFSDFVSVSEHTGIVNSNGRKSW
jgi:hypothetical protein